jgi:hypothetical protein
MNLISFAGGHKRSRMPVVFDESRGINYEFEKNR